MLHRFATGVAKRLRSEGFETFFAGGCVRDRLLGRTPKDYDVATSATPDEVEALFRTSDTFTVPVGAAFGVICIVDPATKMQVEVATFRSDGAYLDGRHPVGVTFSTAEEDAQRRDFTINGLFLDPETEEVIDFVDGQADLENKIVRAIGDPTARFTEDKLRLLRAVRFTATLGFQLQEKTAAAIRNMPEALRVVSAERITAELEKMLLDASRAKGLRMLLDLKLLPTLFPESMPMPGEQQFTNLLEVEAELQTPSLPLALAPLLAAITDAEGAQEVSKRWRLSTRQANRIAWLIQNQRELYGATGKNWSQLQRLLAHQGREELVGWLAAEVACKRAEADDLAYCRERIAWPEEKLNPPPLLSGDTLIAAGLVPGKNFAHLIESTRDAQLDGHISTPEEAIEYAKQLADREA
ncbi:MAG: CCA tRNA nucleotidyltransferase [Planctomycetota bacterium]|nr:CCA tRNA nucleotidyltransferase [Planctomycetota bacterium]